MLWGECPSHGSGTFFSLVLFCRMDEAGVASSRVKSGWTRAGGPKKGEPNSIPSFFILIHWNRPNLTIIPKMSLDPENEFDPGNDRFQPTRFKLQYLVSGRRKEDTGLPTRRDRETEV